MCDDMYDYGYDKGYEDGRDHGYENGRESREWEIEDLEEEIDKLHSMLVEEQGRSQRLGIALLATGLQSHFVDSIANG